VNKCPTLRASGICGLRKSAKAHYVNIVCIPALVLFAMSPARAIDGIGVYTDYHCPWTLDDPYMWTQLSYWPRGPIMKATIVNNKVTRRDTLFRDIGQNPAFSPDGKHIAFFRWGVRISLIAGKWHVVAGTDNNQCYLSVMDADGNNLTNVLPVGTPSVTSTPTRSEDVDEGCAVLDWPRVDGEDWIYYEKPPKTAEIWRVKATDPSTNQFVCRYNSGTFLRRWDLSLDGKWSSGQSRGTYGVDCGTAFPLVNNDLGKTTHVNVEGCNVTISCGGNFLIHNVAEDHSFVVIDRWDHSTNAIVECPDLWWWACDTSRVSGPGFTVPGKGSADQNRCSVNSEKWVCREIEWCNQGFARSEGSNSVAVNWKDKQTIKMSNTPQPPSCPGYGEQLPLGYGICADAGDLWIDFGAGNENKWEDENGTLHPMSSTVAISSQVAAAKAPMLRMLRTGAVVSYPGEYRLTVIDARGDAVAARHGHGPGMVDLRGLHAGLYIVRVHAAGRTYSGKFTASL